MELPRITVITPSFNQGDFIERTLQSVLSQNYPRLQYLVIDGGSKDKSVEIIQKYAGSLDYWVSEPDRGQAHAINKGLERANGEITAYLNSDDYYLPGALWHVARTYQQTKFDVLVGRRFLSTPRRAYLKLSWWKNRFRPFVYPYLLGGNHFHYELPQECIFWSQKKYAGLRFNEDYHFCLDVWWFTRIFSGAKVVHTSRRLGNFELHEKSKTSSQRGTGHREIYDIIEKVAPCADKVTDEMKGEILREYRRVSRLARWTRCLMPWRHFLFQYRLPEYWVIE